MSDYQNALSRVTAEAADYIDNPSKLDTLMIQLEEKLRQVPVIGETVSGLPVVIAMVKSWIKKEYSVSPKVLATIVGAFIYLVKKKDLISDSTPVIGIVDDLAVLALALKFVEPEIKDYKIWRGDDV